MRTAALLSSFVLLLSMLHPFRASAQAPPPATLAQLIAIADERNPVIVTARQAVQASEARVLLARSGRGPVFGSQASAAAAGGATGTTTSAFAGGLAVTGSYLLFDSGVVENAVRAAEANLRSSRLALETVRQDVAQQIGLAYVTVLRNERGVEVAEALLRLNQELLRVAEGQFRAGVVPRADVVRVQADLAAAEGALIAASNAVEQSKVSLNTVVGRTPTTPVGVVEPQLPGPQVTVTAAALPTLVEQRAEIRRAQAEIEAAELTVLVAQASNRLRITLDGRASQALTPTTQSVYSVTGVVSLPISDAGRTDAVVAEAVANLAAARSRLDTTRLAVQQQALLALLSILDARARITSADAQLAFAREALRLAQGRFAAGAGPLLEVTDAQTQLVQAAVTLLRARYDEFSGIISLRYALGRSVVDGAI